MKQPADLDLDDLSRFLAGLPGRGGGGALDRLRATAEWTRLADAQTGLYARFRFQYAEPFACWARRALGGTEAPGALFYPFGGPDCVFPLLLQPGAETYVLCGREGWAPLPGEPAASLATMAWLDRFLRHYLTTSYFITADMSALLEASAAFGVGAVLLALLAHLGMTVDRLAPIALGAAPGLEIAFRDGDRRKRLIYFRHDLRDDYFEAAGPLARFVAGLGPFTAFSKSASYLLHEPHCRSIREFILERAAVIVQDPSGIPFRTLARAGWRVSLHGRHTRTLEVFRRYLQADLIDAFADPSQGCRPLGFAIGYDADPLAAGLMVASARDRA